ncbi:MAG: phosphatase PAP2 family protein [Magnetococcales bacterium]|nr:phosphatase PAP2 family protein [Magnetococcales bacterium]
MAALLLTVVTTAYPNRAVGSDTIETTGDVLQILIPTAGIAATRYLDDDEGSIQFLKSFATTFVITQGLKRAVDKKRPNGSDQSFPSGHTSAAFQGASFIQMRYGWKYGIPSYLGAAFVGYSRVESDHHYVIDVIAGAGLGIASNYFFTTKYKGFTIKPTANRGVYGISLAKSF